QTVFERVREVRVYANPLREARRELAQRGLELRLAGAEEEELGVEQPQRLRRDDLIEALLRDEPRAHAEQRDIGPLRQSPRPLQLGLAADLSGHVVRCEPRRDVMVRGGIPLVDVDAVPDPDETITELPEAVLETEAADVGEQLERVRRTHGRHHIGILEAALQVVETAVP